MTSAKITVSAMALLAATSFSASAQGMMEDAPLYWSGALGVVAGTDFFGSVSVDNIGGNGSYDEAETEAGGLIRGAIGYALSEDTRFEIELAYRERDIGDSFTPDVIPAGLDSTGTLATTTLMLNGLHSAQLGQSDYRLYGGGGIGAAFMDVNFQRGDGTGFTLSEATYTNLASQLRVGTERDLPNGMTLFADYTLLAVMPEYEGFNTFAGDIDQELYMLNHEFAIGIRAEF